MSEIKFDLTLKKKQQQIFCFFYAFRRLSRQKTNFIPSHFASLLFCLGRVGRWGRGGGGGLGGVILSGNAVTQFAPRK